MSRKALQYKDLSADAKDALDLQIQLIRKNLSLYFGRYIDDFDEVLAILIEHITQNYDYSFEEVVNCFLEQDEE